MKIGIVTTWFERGAAYVSKQYKELLDRRHEVHVYARGGESYGKGDPNWDGPNVTWGRKAIFQTNVTPVSKGDILNWVRRNGIEVVIFNEQQWWPPVAWLKDEGVVIGSYVDYYTEETVPLFGAFDFLLCNTRRHLSAFDWHPQAHYLPWGTDTSLFVPGAKKPEDEGKVVFFNSSGYSPDRKGVYPLLKAFSKLEDPAAKLLLHTQVDLKKYYADLEEEVGRLEDEGRLEVVGETVTAPGIYYRGDVYCYISRLDGIGLTLAEAVSCGLQAITPDQPPMNEFVEDGVNGKLVKVSRQFSRSDGYYWPQCEVSEEDLQKQMRYYLDRRAELPQMKETARQYALEHLDWSDRDVQLDEIVSGAAAQPLTDGMREKIRSYELSKSLVKSLARVPYRMMKNFSR